MSVSGAALRALGIKGWIGALRITMTLVMIEAGLRTTRISTLAALAGCHLDLAEADARSGGDPCVHDLRYTATERRELAVAARVMRHWLFPPTCLRRALIVGHILRRRGPRLRVGVTKSDGVVSAHAWLLVDGAQLDFQPQFRHLAVPGAIASP